MHGFFENSNARDLLRHMQNGEYIKAIHNLNALLTPLFMFSLLINGRRIQEMCRCAILSALYAAGMKVVPTHSICFGRTDMSVSHKNVPNVLALRTKIVDGVKRKTPKLHGVSEEEYTKSIELALRDAMVQIYSTRSMRVEHKNPIPVLLVVDADGRFITAFCIDTNAYRYVHGEIFRFGHLEAVEEEGWSNDAYIFVHDEPHKMEKEDPEFGRWSRI